MTELELNKEYTYSQICEVIGWEKKAGNSKKAQINEIESAYEFYHPVNNKAHKEKKTYVFTEKLRELIKPSKSNSGGSNNIKNIRPMVEYLQGKIDLEDNEYYSFTTWYCEKLEILKKEFCNIPYMSSSVIEKVCEENGIADDKLFCKYISLAKAELKNMLLRSLNHLKKKGIIVFEDGYMFTYRLGKKSLGHVNTNYLNDIIKQNETVICNNMNEEHKLSSKMVGRQLLLVIYGNEELKKEFDKMKVSMLMDNEGALKLLNDELEVQIENYCPDCGSICTERPLFSYCRGIAVLNMSDVMDNDTESLVMEIINNIRGKVRKAISKLYYISKYTGKKIYQYNNAFSRDDIFKTEKLLFQHLDEDFTFDDIDDDNWGEVIDFSIEEILDMPTLSEVRMNMANSVCEQQNDLNEEDGGR